jgi:cell division protein FtsA
LRKGNIVAGLDIGTSQVRLIVGELDPDGSVNIIGVGTSPSPGMKKGVIVDLDQTVEAINRAVSEAERMVGMSIDSTYVGLVGTQVNLINNRGVVAVTAEDKEIRDEDVERVLQATKVLALPSDREIIDIMPREFVVDGYDGIKDPVGMLGVRLEVDALIITGAITALRNLTRCVTRAELEIDGLILNAVASAEVILSSDERELGVCLVDIGAGTTEIAFFRQGTLQDLSVLPIGGDHITNDLSVGLRTTFDNAEELKIEHGYALSSMAFTEKKIQIKSIGRKEPHFISENDISQFIEPRVQELLQLVAKEIDKMSGGESPPAGVVFTGGVSLLNGLVEMAEGMFSTSVRISQPDYIGVQSPAYSTAVGLIRYIQRHGAVNVQKKPKARGVFQSLWIRVRNWFVELLD